MAPPERIRYHSSHVTAFSVHYCFGFPPDATLASPCAFHFFFIAASADLRAANFALASSIPVFPPSGACFPRLLSVCPCPCPCTVAVTLRLIGPDLGFSETLLLVNQSVFRRLYRSSFQFRHTLRPNLLS